MRSLLNKIFSGRIGTGYFFVSGFGFILGLAIVLISIQAYLKIDNFLNPKKNFSEYLILNKQVGLGNTIFGAKAAFSSEDIEDLRKQPFVEDLGEFRSNYFESRLSVGGNIGFVTEIFFESVPDRFIDDRPYSFHWKEGDEVVPIIVSQDFLNLYNFGYALGRGTPQLSRSTIGLVPLILDISGPGGRRIFNAKVVGFSERVPSVLVPQEFLEWANKNVGKVKEEKVSRVIVKTKGGDTGGMEDYLSSHGLTVGQDKLKVSRISTFVSIAMSVLLVIGMVFIAYALIIVVMNFTLMLAEAKEEMKLLFQLGYKRRYIFNYLFMYLALLLLLEVMFALLVFLLINHGFITFLGDYGIEVSSSVELPVYIGGVVFVAISFIVSVIAVRRALIAHS